MLVRCADCSKEFVAKERWMVRCYPCWQKRSKPSKPSAAVQDKFDKIFDEVKRNVRELIQLCHPDKHGGSELSHKMTKMLLQIKQDLER